MVPDFQPIIGLEVHAQLVTESKIFCGCSTRFGAEPNVQTCPICLGLPGVLPVLNKIVVEYAIKAGLALHCEINSICKFDRKNYFYPDLPKGYQITQYDQPICHSGYLDLSDDQSQPFRVRINRIHLEEDAGKLVHKSEDCGSRSGVGLVDLNRTGVPLIEIVTEPDIQSPDQARVYLNALKSILEYLEISDCNMEEGSLRVDANISLRPVNSNKLGNRIELKNMNSFRALEKALDFEIRRQTQILSNRGQVIQETRMWDEKIEETIVMRGKEDAGDYRYLPEPDLPPLEISAKWIGEIRKTLDELPHERRTRLINQYDLPEYDAQVLTIDKRLADFFESAVSEYPNPKIVSNWIMGDFLRLVKEKDLEYDQLILTGSHLAELLKMIDQGIISGKIAKIVFEEMFETGMQPEKIVEQRNLKQINDKSQLSVIVDKVLANNPAAIDDYYAGKERARKYLIGQVMKETEGIANPQLVVMILGEKLKS